MSVADNVKVGSVPLYQPFDPFGEVGFSVIAVAGLTVSSLTMLDEVMVPWMPALSDTTYSYW